MKKLKKSINWYTTTRFKCDTWSSWKECLSLKLSLLQLIISFANSRSIYGVVVQLYVCRDFVWIRCLFPSLVTKLLWYDGNSADSFHHGTPFDQHSTKAELFFSRSVQHQEDFQALTLRFDATYEHENRWRIRSRDAALNQSSKCLVCVERIVVFSWWHEIHYGSCLFDTELLLQIIFWVCPKRATYSQRASWQNISWQKFFDSEPAVCWRIWQICTEAFR